MFRKILIANRGAIAVRILRTLSRMDIASVAIYSEADASSPHAIHADESILVGQGPAQESYLAIPKVIDAAIRTGAEAIHPGYGFLSESLEFARACLANNISFIGPSISNIEAFARKHTARQIAQSNGIPLLPGTGLLSDVATALNSAESLGYPVMLKSSAGGGGIGMKICFNPGELATAFESVIRLSHNSFGDGSVYLERYVANAKHVEVQIFGDGSGEVLTLGARDCSAQRRHQKVIEETPVPNIPDSILQELFAYAGTLGKAVHYRSAGTVEFLYDMDRDATYFLEVNTRLQVEHGITEQVTGLDLVEMMILEAAGELGSLDQYKRVPRGCSIEARLYAEDPAKAFQPAPGLLTKVVFPPPSRARTETWVESGSEVTPYYDPMLAKIIVLGSNRAEAVSRLQEALAVSQLSGTETNLRYLQAIASSPIFADGLVTTTLLNNFHVNRYVLEVIESGTQTTLQDYPGRLHYWHVGVPPSGPMDSFSFRIANRLVGNDESAPGIEMTGIGGKFRFSCDTAVAICGADMLPTIDGTCVPLWQTLRVSAGATLTFGPVQGAGNRTYLAVHGGFDVPSYLGSASTFMLGKFGGHAGRALRSGDVLHLTPRLDWDKIALSELVPTPSYSNHWKIGVLYGPHGAPEFFTDSDIDILFSAHWQVHYQSDRTGVRLTGPKPVWARRDGGEAGLHPSNIHDNAYAIGSIDFTGDMPILLGPDGPSLGGFVCPAVVVSAELWKIGQLRPGDTIQFIRLSSLEAEALNHRQIAIIQTLQGALREVVADTSPADCILKLDNTYSPAMTCRSAGDKYLLIEYGQKVLDLSLRFRVHLLEQRLREMALPGMIDITPGIRSLQIHYESRLLSREHLLKHLEDMNRDLSQFHDVTVPSRIVHLPLSWDDPSTRAAQRKYMQSVRPDAPWCPDNIEFIRRINGLSSMEDVKEIVHSANYLVLGLGDVYLGAPVATPIDPRHRMVTTKYNPARTWTPENAVGIGGAYMCVYGMEGPGGYQLVGRTVQVWNTYRSTQTFPEGKPWSLECFDQIKFHPASANELLEKRREILHGGYEVEMERTSFNLAEYQAFLASIQSESLEFREKQKEAFAEERERWARDGLLESNLLSDQKDDSVIDGRVPEGCVAVNAPMTASIYELSVAVGERVEVGQRIVVLDAMKTEIMVASPVKGEILEVRCRPGQLVASGQSIIIIRL